MNASRYVKQRMPHVDRSKSYVQSLQTVILPAVRYAQLQEQRSLQGQKTWPQKWSGRGPALEARLQVQY